MDDLLKYGDFLGYPITNIERYETNNRNGQQLPNLTFVGGITTAYQENLKLTILTNTDELACDLQIHFDIHNTTIPFQVTIPQHPLTDNFPNTYLGRGRTYQTDGGGLFLVRRSNESEAALESAKGRYFTYTRSKKIHQIKDIVREGRGRYRINTNHLILTPDRLPVNIDASPMGWFRYKRIDPIRIEDGVITRSPIVYLEEDLQYES